MPKNVNLIGALEEMSGDHCQGFMDVCTKSNVMQTTIIPSSLPDRDCAYSPNECSCVMPSRKMERDGTKLVWQYQSGYDGLGQIQVQV